jgi:hypothetical protein
VEEIPVTTWFRPVAGPLRAEGIPEPGGDLPFWRLDARGNYRGLTAAARRRLAAA